jgi:hypothetical protein
MVWIIFLKTVYSGKISIARTFVLPVFAHGNEDLEDLLDGYGINAALDRLFEDRFQHTGSPGFIVNGEAFGNLDLCDLPGEFLPLCYEPNYLGIHL